MNSNELYSIDIRNELEKISIDEKSLRYLILNIKN